MGGAGGRMTGMTKDCGQGTSRSSIRIEAECAHGPNVGKCNGAVSGAQSGTMLENGDTDVGYIDPGDWLRFDSIPLTGMTRLRLRYAKGTEGGGVDVRLDTQTGKSIGKRDLPSTGSWTTWSDLDIPLEMTSDSHTLFLVATGEGTAGVLNVDSLLLDDGQSTTTTPTNAGVTGMHINQLGYEALGPKYAVVEATGAPTSFEVVDSGGKAVWCGDLQATAFDAWGGKNPYYVVDFSGLTAVGTFRISVGSSSSDEFEIAQGRYVGATLESVLGYFKASRADDGDVWAADQKLPVTGSDRVVDARGGWYDASGDISKYLSHLSYANFLNPQQIPLVAWALGWVRDEAGAVPAVQKLMPGLEQEALWGADYLLRVLSQEGYFYATVFDGWSGELGARKVCAFEGSMGTITANYKAALREGGGMSIAALARIGAWGVAGSFPASQYIDGAKRAFEHLRTNNTAYADDGKENIIDDYAGLLAASELFAATHDNQYLEAARTRADSLIARIAPDGYFIADGGSRPFWHASDAGLPVVALTRYAALEPDAGRVGKARTGVQKHLEYLVKVTGEVKNPFGYARQHFKSGGSLKSGFFIPHDNETGYWWQGENARLGSLAAAALIGGRFAYPASPGMLRVPDALAGYAARQIDWILGENPLDICFLQGFGKKGPGEYCAKKPQNTALKGGIPNGITGRETDGSGFQWLSNAPAGMCFEDWRWSELWLPHSAWYMVAATAMAQ